MWQEFVGLFQNVVFILGRGQLCWMVIHCLLKTFPMWLGCRCVQFSPSPPSILFHMYMPYTFRVFRSHKWGSSYYTHIIMKKSGTKELFKNVQVSTSVKLFFNRTLLKLEQNVIWVKVKSSSMRFVLKQCNFTVSWGRAVAQ